MSPNEMFDEVLESDMPTNTHNDTTPTQTKSVTEHNRALEQFQCQAQWWIHIKELMQLTHVEFTKHTTYNVRLNLIQHIDNINNNNNNNNNSTKRRHS